MTISGYKSLLNFELDDIQSDLNVFIGENNVGKSNILKAIDTFFNKDKLDINDIPISLNSYFKNKDIGRNLYISEFHKNKC
jgi:AAA15 family ATPase/GTPase